MDGPAHHDPPGIWHAALPYRSADEMVTAACQFARDGAQAGAAVLLACTASSLGRIQARLSGAGKHVTVADISGPDANPGRMIHSIIRLAGRQPGRPAWILHEAAWPSRPADELWEVIRYEALLNLVLAAPVRVLCPYHATLPPEVISCAWAAHPLTARDGRWQPSPGYRHRPGPAMVPPACNQPLPPPPGDASTLAYRDDLAGVRSLVSAEARTAGLPASRTSDLVLAIGELTANTVAHASGPGSLSVWATPAEVICQVSDSGHISDPLAGQLRPGPAIDGGGRGLWMVHQLCDLVQVRTGEAGTTVRVHMRL